MGVLDRFERGLERVVNGAFAKTFRSEVQPVELASALRREADDKAAIMDRGRTLIPNRYVIDLSPTDYARLSEYADTLPGELADVVRRHARSQGYVLPGPVSVTLGRSDDRATGIYEVSSRSERAAPSAGRPVPARPPVPTARPTVGREPARPALRPVVDVDGRRLVLDHPVVVGRSSDADVTVTDTGVSRHHLRLDWDGHAVTAEDLGSTNGTYLDGRPIGRAVLPPGATLTIGRTRIRLDYERVPRDE